MIEALPFLVSGLIFGLIAGISPGPLLALVITETLRHGKKQGIKVAITPLISDIPIILITLMLLSEVTNYNSVLGVISFLGAGFILYLGYETITTRGIEVDVKSANTRPIRKGILVNTFSPHPYIFWLTIGASFIYKSYKANLFATIGFLALFYLMLVGSKMMVAILVDRSRRFLQGRIYIRTMRVMGFVLVIFAYLFFVEGLKYLGLL